MLQLSDLDSRRLGSLRETIVRHNLRTIGRTHKKRYGDFEVTHLEDTADNARGLKISNAHTQERILLYQKTAASNLHAESGYVFRNVS